MWIQRKTEFLLYLGYVLAFKSSRLDTDRAVQVEFVQTSVGRNLRPPNRQKSTLKLSMRTLLEGCTNNPSAHRHRSARMIETFLKISGD